MGLTGTQVRSLCSKGSHYATQEVDKLLQYLQVRTMSLCRHCSVVQTKTRSLSLTCEWGPTFICWILSSHSIPSIWSTPATRGRYRHQTHQQKQRPPTSQTDTSGSCRWSLERRSAHPNRFISLKSFLTAEGSRTFAFSLCCQLVKVSLT